MWRALVLLVLLAGCARPLTEAERAFSAELFGEATAASRLRLLEAGPVGVWSVTYPVRPRTTCRERILPPIEGPTFEARTAGIALWDHLLINPDWYLSDYLENWPEEINLVAVMFFAHELTHVWQWQNRDRTGYSIGKVAREHTRLEDPYLFDTGDLPRFLDYGYEQQASLVEEYVCCSALDPEGARTDRLRRLLGQELPLSEFTVPESVLLPDSGTEIAGICS